MGSESGNGVERLCRRRNSAGWASKYGYRVLRDEPALQTELGPGRVEVDSAGDRSVDDFRGKCCICLEFPAVGQTPERSEKWSAACQYCREVFIRRMEEIEGRQLPFLTTWEERHPRKFGWSSTLGYLTEEWAGLVGLACLGGRKGHAGTGGKDELLLVRARKIRELIKELDRSLSAPDDNSE
eukprot:TRINITY_DN147_c0_g1_i2.p1 TRINITY_DN147_c0_g1~~TRINITY_DN147_c0_g1_i2.p1  ORF type:complete len:183 (+),score=11.74 TRINITY_DN147_c0_g1_i2:166-714(+)